MNWVFAPLEIGLDNTNQRNHNATIKEHEPTETNMPSITVKNIPNHAYEILKQVATTNHRSINSEIICLIEKATISQPFSQEHYFAQAKRSRQKTKNFLLTEGVLQKIKDEGRP